MARTDHYLARASGLSGQVFYQQQQLAYHQFVYWRQKYRTLEDNISPGFAKVTAAVQANPAELTLSLPNGLVIAGLNDRNVILLGAIHVAERLNQQESPRILILYGSVRERAYSRLAGEETGRLLTAMGAEVKTFNPSGLPLPDDAPETHPKVVELRELVRWCDGMVWSSPERHGAMSAVMKAQIDWIPLSEEAVRPSQGKTLAVMQVCGGSQSFNAVSQKRAPSSYGSSTTLLNRSAYLKKHEISRLIICSLYNINIS